MLHFSPKHRCALLIASLACVLSACGTNSLPPSGANAASNDASGALPYGQDTPPAQAAADVGSAAYPPVPSDAQPPEQALATPPNDATDNATGSDPNPKGQNVDDALSQARAAAAAVQPNADHTPCNSQSTDPQCGSGQVAAANFSAIGGSDVYQTADN